MNALADADDLAQLRHFCVEGDLLEVQDRVQHMVFPVRNGTWPLSELFYFFVHNPNAAALVKELTIESAEGTSLATISATDIVAVARLTPNLHRLIARAFRCIPRDDHSLLPTPEMYQTPPSCIPHLILESIHVAAHTTALITLTASRRWRSVLMEDVHHVNVPALAEVPTASVEELTIFHSLRADPAVAFPITTCSFRDVTHLALHNVDNAYIEPLGALLIASSASLERLQLSLYECLSVDIVRKWLQLRIPTCPRLRQFSLGIRIPRPHSPSAIEALVVQTLLEHVARATGSYCLSFGVQFVFDDVPSALIGTFLDDFDWPALSENFSTAALALMALHVVGLRGSGTAWTRPRQIIIQAAFPFMPARIRTTRPNVLILARDDMEVERVRLLSPFWSRGRVF